MNRMNALCIACVLAASGLLACANAPHSPGASPTDSNSAYEKEIREELQRLLAIEDQDEFFGGVWAALYEQGVEVLIKHGTVAIIGGGVDLLVDQSLDQGQWVFTLDDGGRVSLPATRWVRFAYDNQLQTAPPDSFVGEDPTQILVCSGERLMLIDISEATMRRVSLTDGESDPTH